MPLDRIAARLTRKTGLDPAALGAGALAQAVQRRMAACGLVDAARYEETLLASEEQWQLLIDEVVVRETWFFRYGPSFAFLARHVRDHWFPAHPGRVLRVLSVPCATGEEACSIAITLLEARVPARSFQIDAMDVSRKAIARCREARYGKSSFRGGHQELRRRYFTASGNEYRPLPVVTGCIRFWPANLLEPDFAAGRAPYDVVFCRNLLIYFELAVRKLAVANLDRLLADDGILFAGHTETAYTLGGRFALLDEPQAFAYRKLAASPRIDRKKTGLRPSRTPEKATISAACQMPLPVVSEVRSDRAQSDPLALPRQTGYLGIRPSQRPDGRETPMSAPSASPADAASRLAKAGQLANEGALDAAAAICRQLIAGESPCAETYCLLGLIEESRGDRIQAEGCYTRALYLDPGHYESLVHLLLLVESRGDAARAAALRARIRRTTQREKHHAG